jgi:NAD(P)-dependent dehydrogenase (short-subunit alcohol dehydrogenase family)
MDLTGRSVIVTGASSGIGRETAILLSSLNARIVLVGRNEERLRETLGRLHGTGHTISVFDLSATDQIVNWMKSLAAQSGPFHALVHAAGKQLTIPARLLSAAALDDLLRANLSSALMLARGFCQKGCRTAGASIVYISSIMGMVGKPGISAYSASKAALIGMTKSLAIELAPEKLRVNCIAPAFVQTEMLDQIRESLPAEQFAVLEQAHPLGFGTPRDIANAAAFLVAETGRWITGSTLVVDGGYSAQ